MRRWSLALPLLSLAAAAIAAPAADVTVLDAAHIYTSNPQQPQVQAIAWGKDGRLLATGDLATLAGRYPKAHRVSLPKATLLPGLIDAHGHVMGLGWSLLQANLVGSRSKPEVIERLQAFEKTLAPGAWLTGSGWDQNDWPDKAFPTAADLDAAFPDRPVWLERIDGHAGWANSAALKLAAAKEPRLLQAQWQPEGGRIEREAILWEYGRTPGAVERLADQLGAQGARDAVVEVSYYAWLLNTRDPADRGATDPFALRRLMDACAAAGDEVTAEKVRARNSDSGSLPAARSMK